MSSCYVSAEQVQAYAVRLRPLLCDLGIDPLAPVDQMLPSAETIVRISRSNVTELKRKVIRLRQDVRRAVRDGDADWVDGFRGEHFKWDWNEWRANIDKLRSELDQMQHDHRKAMWVLQRTLAAKRKVEVVIHELRDVKAESELSHLATEMNQDANDEDEWMQEQQEEEWKAEGKARAKRRSWDKAYEERMRKVDSKEKAPAELTDA